MGMGTMDTYCDPFVAFHFSCFENNRFLDAVQEREMQIYCPIFPFMSVSIKGYYWKLRIYVLEIWYYWWNNTLLVNGHIRRRFTKSSIRVLYTCGGISLIVSYFGIQCFGEYFVVGINLWLQVLNNTRGVKFISCKAQKRYCFTGGIASGTILLDPQSLVAKWAFPSSIILTILIAVEEVVVSVVSCSIKMWTFWGNSWTLLWWVLIAYYDESTTQGHSRVQTLTKLISQVSDIFIFKASSLLTSVFLSVQTKR